MINKLKVILGIFVTVSLFLFFNISSVKAIENTNITFTGKMTIEKMEKLKDINEPLYNQYLTYKDSFHNRCTEEYGQDNYYYLIEKMARNENEFIFIYGGTTGNKDYFRGICFKRGTNDIEPNISAKYYYGSLNSYSTLYTSSTYKALHNDSYSDYYNKTDWIYGSLIFNMENGRNVSNYIDSNISFKYSSSSIFTCPNGGSNCYDVDSFTVNNITYKNNDIIVSNNSMHNPVINPDISFKMTDSEKFKYNGKEYYSSQKWKTNFNFVDNEQYYYVFSTDNGKTWKTITMVNQSYFEKSFISNSTFIVKVIDKNTNKDVKISTLELTNFEKYNVDGTVYDNVLKIRLSDIYNSDDKSFNNVHKFFLSQKLGSTYSQFRIERVPYEGISDNKPIPLYLWYELNIADIRSYLKAVKDSPNSDPSGYGGGFSSNGGTFGGGGGGGRFDDESAICSSLPATLNKKMHSDTIYGSLIIDFHKCKELNGTNLSDYTTEYIYIFYNARLYDNIDDVLNDYMDQVGGGNLDENSPLGMIISPFLNFINNKFPIIQQSMNIYEKWKYNEFSNEMPNFTINTSFLGSNEDIIILDLTFYRDNRNIIFFYMRVFLAIFVLWHYLPLVKQLFDGGDG